MLLPQNIGNQLVQTYFQKYSIIYKHILNRFKHIVSKNYETMQSRKKYVNEIYKIK